MPTEVRATDLLIAPPAMIDSRFKNSVLMLTHNNPQGSFALCLNRPLGKTLPEVVGNDIDVDYIPNFPIYWGGPISPNSLWMIHSPDWVIEGTVMITSAWAMTSSEAMFHCFADGDVPKYFRLVMGYAGWAPGQLTSEIEGFGPYHKDNSWLVAHNLGPDWLLDQDPEELWGSVITLSSHQAVDSWL